jgi:prolyl oligopeptidase
MPMRIGGVALAVSLIAACDSSDARGPGRSLAYPDARPDTVVDVYHGTRVADPYRWLERLSTPEVRAWAAAQTALVSQPSSSDSLRHWFLERMRHHAKVWDQFEGVGGADSAPSLLEPRTLPAGKKLVRSQTSPDGKYVTYALSEGASEWVETRIRRIADGVDLPGVLDGMLGGVPLWSRDSRGIFYVHQRRGSDADRVMLLEPSVRYHAIDTPQSADRILFATPPGSVESVVQISYASSGRYLVIAEGSGAVWDPFAWVLSRMHLLDLGSGPVPAISNPVTPMVADKIAGYRVIASDGPTFYVMTDRAAPRKRVVAVDVRDPAPEKWRDVIPQDAKLVMHAMRRINDRWVGVYFADVQPLIRVFSSDGRLLRTMQLPPFSSVPEIEPGERESELIVSTSSFLQPPTRTAFDVSTGTSRVVQTASSDFDAASYVTTQQWYTSKDGTRVPMFIVHRRDIPLDGSHPALMLGYGASGSVMLPEFAENVLAWLEAGGIFAVPSLRGGGEFGREWYEAAILDRKQTTIDDFIAAAEWLIESGYTKPERLAIRGASNGGLLVSATITQRPDLFGAAIVEVPITDNLRYDRGRHRGQFGHVSDSAQFEVLYRYSPLHRVAKGTCYPATLITTALNDDRAPAWHALKLTAALQAAQSCDRPILLRAMEAGGHSGDRGPDSWMEDAADALAFVGRRLGALDRLLGPVHGIHRLP